MGRDRGECRRAIPDILQEFGDKRLQRSADFFTLFRVDAGGLASRIAAMPSRMRPLVAVGMRWGGIQWKCLSCVLLTLLAFWK